MAVDLFFERATAAARAATAPTPYMTPFDPTVSETEATREAEAVWFLAALMSSATTPQAALVAFLAVSSSLLSC